MASKPEMSCQEILTKVSQEKLTKKCGLRRFLSRNLYKNVFIKKTTPLLSDRLKGAIEKKEGLVMLGKVGCLVKKCEP
jgi:hypothetical protein